METYNARQRKIIREMKERKPTIFQKASMGDKASRHILSELGFDCDYDESDMCDYPRGYVMN